MRGLSRPWHSPPLSSFPGDRLDRQTPAAPAALMNRPPFYPQGARIAVLTQEVVGILDYLAPEGGVRLGQLVVVPLGPRP